jgi:hypothetical protein
MTETERLREAIVTFMDAYRARYKNAFGTVRSNAPMRDEATALNSAALASSPPVERGEWQTVPVEPTLEMIVEGSEVEDVHGALATETARRVWAAMLKAAPNPTGMRPSNSTTPEGERGS